MMKHSGFSCTGNPDTLGSEFLESLLKMAPTKEEERKLKDESPLNLGCSAEKFVKAVIDVPFAFKRVEAMLFIVNFDSEVDYLRSSFKTLEAASDELRRSRTFLKLIEAVLKTGNRMNVGTNRGNAHAFKLDTLLMLAHVKATDGKTTLLHFVVQEIIKSEHSHLPDSNVDIQSENTEQSAFKHDMEFRKLGLQVVSRLSEELVNVKKAATLDSTVISSEVVRLAAGIPKIKEAVKLNEEICLKESSRSRSRKFSDSMNTFLGKAEEEITSVEAEEAVVVSKVKETMEFFHGKSGKEEVNLFRIFTVVRDFVSILDRVCREVGKIDERTIYSSVRAMPVNF